jgi:hypothetical protein
MNEQDYNQLRENGWRRPLTESETAELQKYWAAHPAAREEWENDTALNRLMERLPSAPAVSSNFTARVLQMAALEKAARERTNGRVGFGWDYLRSWLPKAAVAALAITLGIASYHMHEVNTHAALAKNAVEFTAAVAASDPEAIGDIEPIRQLSDAQPKADVELIALMK